MSAPLLELADAWICDYRDHHHLRRTLHWLRVLEPDSSIALQLAALTHDMERFYPGGPQMDPAVSEPDDEEYNKAHQERSARIVGDWLRDRGAPEQLARDVSFLVSRHELGGTPEQDLLQAADSISFLETKVDLMLGWLAGGRCDRERALRQPTWMVERIRLERARLLARPFYQETCARVLSA